MQNAKNLCCKSLKSQKLDYGIIVMDMGYQVDVTKIIFIVKPVNFFNELSTFHFKFHGQHLSIIEFEFMLSRDFM